MIIRADVYPHSPHRSDKSTKTEGDLQVAVAMAMAMAVAGRRSTLNPDAPIFIPVAFQQVEDFSPEWWELVKTSTWFRDYWLTQHQEGESYDDNTDDDDIANLLPESFDIGFDEYNLDAQFEELIRSSESENQSTLCASMKEKPINGSNMNIEALMKNLSSPKISNEKGPKHLGEPAKFRGKPLQCVSPKSGPRRIHQPR